MNGLRSVRQGQDSLWSWVVSAALHTLAIGTATPLLLQYTVPPRLDTFRWEVAIRESPPPEPLAAETPSPQPSADAPPPLTDLSPAEWEALRTEPLSTFGDIDAGTPSATVPLEDADIPVTSASMRATAGAEAHDPAQTSSQATASGQSAASGMPPSPEATPLGAAGPATLPPPEVEPVQPSPIAQDLVEEELRRVMQRPGAVERAVRYRSMQTDYGWLAQSIWDTVERYKRYPYLARMNRWEGKVVLEAVIHRTGDVSRVAVVESSGHAILDENAVETLRRCAPVKLAHALDRREVTLHIPIMYRLD